MEREDGRKDGCRQRGAQVARRAVEAKGRVGSHVLEAASIARGAGRGLKGVPPTPRERWVGLTIQLPGPVLTSHYPGPQRQKLGLIV